MAAEKTKPYTILWMGECGNLWVPRVAIIIVTRRNHRPKM